MTAPVDFAALAEAMSKQDMAIAFAALRKERNELEKEQAAIRYMNVEYCKQLADAVAAAATLQKERDELRTKLVETERERNEAVAKNARMLLIIERSAILLGKTEADRRAAEQECAALRKTFAEFLAALDHSASVDTTHDLAATLYYAEAEKAARDAIAQGKT